MAASTRPWHERSLETFYGMLYLARNKWWLLLAIIAADIVIALTIADTVIRWELELLREMWRGGGQ